METLFASIFTQLCLPGYGYIAPQRESMGALSQDVADMERSKGRPKAVDKYREETVWSQIVHSNWVSHVQYVPELESALSCSLDKYLWLMDVERRYEHRRMTVLLQLRSLLQSGHHW